MKYYSVDAFIIKAMDYGESHRILTLFSREDGKINAIAKGVKKPKNALRGALQLGNRCQILVYRGRGLDTVSQAAVKTVYPAIWQSHKDYIYASYFMELLNISLPEREENIEIFELTAKTFASLGKVAQEPLARYFELQILSLLGYDSDFSHCSSCGAELKQGYLSPRFPGLVCEKCGSGYSVSPQGLYALTYYRSSEPGYLERLRIGDEVTRQVANVTKHMLIYNLDRRIKSLDIIKDI
ncbi:MAG: DNA repair protein RecO [Bacillota bacterium]|nr:DNA repair protein RecO [Bacillota bacterium]